MFTLILIKLAVCASALIGALFIVFLCGTPPRRLVQAVCEWFGDEVLDTEKFDGANSVRTAPEGHPEVKDLHVYYDGQQNISLWKLSPIGRIRAALFGEVWLGVMGFTLPPVWLSTGNVRRQMVLCPACAVKPPEKQIFYRITFKQSNVYECGCGAIFIRRPNGFTRLMVDPDPMGEKVAPAVPWYRVKWWMRVKQTKKDGLDEARFFVPWWGWPMELIHRMIWGRITVQAIKTENGGTAFLSAEKHQ